MTHDQHDQHDQAVSPYEVRLTLRRLARLARKYSPDQPRADNGQFGEGSGDGGSGGGGAGSAARAALGEKAGAFQQKLDAAVPGIVAAGNEKKGIQQVLTTAEQRTWNGALHNWTFGTRPEAQALRAELARTGLTPVPADAYLPIARATAQSTFDDPAQTSLRAKFPNYVDKEVASLQAASSTYQGQEATFAKGYLYTQAVLAEQGVESMTLYRGMNLSHVSPDEIASGTVSYARMPVESWATTPEAAERFASYGGSVVRITVPASEVLTSSALSTRFRAREEEVLVMPQSPTLQLKTGDNLFARGQLPRSPTTTSSGKRWAGSRPLPQKAPASGGRTRLVVADAGIFEDALHGDEQTDLPAAVVLPAPAATAKKNQPQERDAGGRPPHGKEERP